LACRQPSYWERERLRRRFRSRTASSQGWGFNLSAASPILAIFVAQSGTLLSIASLLECTFETVMAVVLVDIAVYGSYHFVEVLARTWIRTKFSPMPLLRTAAAK
jgi:hypothetical protein